MKILKIRLKTQDLESLRDFYLHKLDFRPIEDQKNFFSFQAGASLLEFEGNQSGEVHPEYHFAFNIPHNLLKDARDWLHSKGLKLLQYEGKEIVDFPDWNAKALYFIDPTGNIVEFIARYDLQNQADSPFESQKITEISEIGLPVPSVKETYEALHEAFGLNIYGTTSNLISFCAAGDPKGLFIIVSLERPWFLTDTVNGIYPMEILIEGTSNHQLFIKNLPYRIESVVK